MSESTATYAPREMVNLAMFKVDVFSIDAIVDFDENEYGNSPLSMDT